MHLVDPNIAFRVVYALYHHEYLGYLMSAHYVQELPNGNLSLVHQGAYPENIETFSEAITDLDRELIPILNEILPREVIKKFRGNPRQEADFFMKKFDGELKKMALRHVNRQLGKALPLMSQVEVFEMGRDSYPAQKPLKVTDEQASILFHFRRLETFTRYYPTIKFRGEKIEFLNNAVLVAEEPAYILYKEEIFSFVPVLDGRKLKAFLKKPFIAIPREREPEYYAKFVTQIVERYPVFAKGFEIEEVQIEPSFHLAVKVGESGSLSFHREVAYGRFRFALHSKGKAKAMLEREDEETYRFYRIIRDCLQEQALLEKLEKIAPAPNSLTPWEHVPREEGLAWMAAHLEDIQQLGLQIDQEEEETNFSLETPRLELDTKASGDWFDIQAVVLIGGFKIPFIKFRPYILRLKREYPLPDGRIAILPENWFSDYRHLLEVSEEKGEEHLRIKKYQAPLLNGATGQGDKKAFIDQLRELDEIPLIDPPAGLQATLRPYQAQGFSWLCFMQEYQMGAILADDMGLGKTLQALTLLLHQKEIGKSEQPSLVVLPTSLVANWRKEAWKFAPDLKVHTHTGVNREKKLDHFSRYDIVLTTYGIVRQDIKQLADYPFHYVILDESQTIKNPDSKTSKAVKELVANHRISLTGTPIENTVMDLWSQMSFLNPGLLGNEAFFKQFYVSPIEREKDAKRSAKLRAIMSPFLLRRRKEQVEADLPPKVEKLHYCDMVGEQQKYYEEIRSTYRNYLLELISSGALKKNKLNILTGLQKLRQIAIHPQLVEPDAYKLKDSGKYREVKRILQSILQKEGSKVLIFSQFVKMLTLLREDLDNEKIRYNYLDGGTRDRQDQVDTFQDNPDIRVFLISLKAGGVGLNLTAADYVFILDPWWNPAVENQAIDRSHRIGQKRTVFYYKFITQNTIEEKILTLQRQKAALSDDIISVESDFYKSLDATALEDLLK